MEILTDFIFLGSKITVDGDCSHEIKRCLIIGRKVMTNLDTILKSRHSKGLSSRSYGFSTSHVWMWKVDHKDGWALKNWCFRTAVLEKTLKSHWKARRSNQSILKKMSPEYSLEGLMLKFQYFGHLMWRLDSLEKTLMLENFEVRKRRGQQRVWWPHRLNGHKFEKTLGDREGQGSLACYSPWGCKESDTTEWLNNKVIRAYFSMFTNMRPRNTYYHTWYMSFCEIKMLG